MATFRKRARSWYAEVNKNGIRKSATYPTKAEAVNWAATVEAEILAGKRGDVPPNKTFRDLLQKYHDEVSPTKSGTRWEQIRIKLFMRYPLADVKLTELNSTHFTSWRDKRLSEVSAGSVLREWNILSNACKRARDEWHWMKDNPLKSVAKPTKPKARDRRPTDEETEAIKLCSGYRPDVPLKTATSRVGAAYLFSIETALRAGELAALRWSEVLLDDGYMKITGIEAGAKKNNAAVRSVPLTNEAIRILNQLKLTTADKPFVFDLTISNLDALFRKAKERAGIDDLTYHDTRHEAITRLARKYDVLDLARIVGHTNIRELLTYYNPSIEEMVKRLRG